MFASPAFAQTAGGAVGSDATAQLLGIAPLFLVFIAFYFLMIRPQQKRMKELQNAVNAVKKGDEITTAGGIIGKVTKVDDRVAEVEIAQGVRVRVVKSTIASVASTGAAKPAND